MATEPEDRAAMLAEEPPMPLLWGTNQPAQQLHVYLGGITEWLCHQAKIETPAWAVDTDRYHDQPVFERSNLTEEEKAYAVSQALPELAARNDFIPHSLHKRAMRWILAFDPEHTERRRRINAESAKVDKRGVRLVSPMAMEGHTVPQEEAELRRRIAKDIFFEPYLRLEEALAAHGVTAEELSIDLSPARPGMSVRGDKLKIA